jgi:hypothetical protein
MNDGVLLVRALLSGVLAESLKKMHKETCDTPNDEP